MVTLLVLNVSWIADLQDIRGSTGLTRIYVDLPGFS